MANPLFRSRNQKSVDGDAKLTSEGPVQAEFLNKLERIIWRDHWSVMNAEL